MASQELYGTVSDQLETLQTQLAQAISNYDWVEAVAQAVAVAEISRVMVNIFAELERPTHDPSIQRTTRS